MTDNPTGQVTASAADYYEQNFVPALFGSRTQALLDMAGDDPVVSFYLWFYHSLSGIEQPLEVHVSNDNGTTWTPVMKAYNRTEWVLRSFRVSDYVIPTSTMRTLPCASISWWAPLPTPWRISVWRNCPTTLIPPTTAGRWRTSSSPSWKPV